jgi:hypothetical protein
MSNENRKIKGTFVISATIYEEGEISLGIMIDKATTQEIAKIMFSSIAQLNNSVAGFEGRDEIVSSKSEIYKGE